MLRLHQKRCLNSERINSIEDRIWTGCDSSAYGSFQNSENYEYCNGNLKRKSRSKFSKQYLDKQKESHFNDYHGLNQFRENEVPEEIKKIDSKLFSTYDKRDVLPLSIHTYQNYNEFCPNIAKFALTEKRKKQEFKVSKPKMFSRYVKNSNKNKFPLEFCGSMMNPVSNQKISLCAHDVSTIYNKCSQHDIVEDIPSPKDSNFSFGECLSPAAALQSVYSGTNNKMSILSQFAKQDG